MTAPTKPDELEELLGDHGALMKMLGDEPGKFRDLVSGYVTKVNDRDKSLRAQVEEQTTAVLAAWIKEQGQEGVVRPDLRPDDAPRPTNALHNPKAIGAQIDDLFDGSADYFRTIWHNAEPTPELQAKRTKIRNAFSSAVPSEGGFLIPETLRSELLRVALETAVVRPRARVIPMESSRVPFPAVDSTSNVSSVHGGIVGYWTEEGAALTASSASFGRIVLDAKKLTAYTEVPSELVSDSGISLQAFIDQMFPEALAWYEDSAFISGTGVGEPLGFLNASAAVSVTKESGQAAATVLWENIVKMFARMLPGSLSRAVWVVSHDVWPELATMALSVGTGGGPIWLTDGTSGSPMSLLGRPVIINEKTNVLGTEGDINFVDLGYYLIGDRQAMTATSSEHYRFGNDQTAYRIIERVDGRPWLNNALTPKNNGPTLSPFVKLATRA